MAQKTIHVYSKEIPWKNQAVTVDENKTYSIQTAINKANEKDVVVVHEGIYRETIVVKSGVSIRNFKTDYVLVTGTEVVKGWKKAKNMPARVMEADVSRLNIEPKYTQLFANGKSEMMARHPNNTIGKMMQPLRANSGYALLGDIYKNAGENANGYATLMKTNLPKVNLKGGIFRGLIGKNRHNVFGKISKNTGNSVTFKGINEGYWKGKGSENAIDKSFHKFGWGFVLHKNLLDTPGEWFVDQNKVYYMPQVGQSINNVRVEVQVRKKVLILNNTNKVSIQGINFVAGNVDMRNTSKATIANCSIRYLQPFWIPNGYGQAQTDQTGVYLLNSSNNTFKNVYAAHSWGNVFAMKNGEKNRFENCVITDFGWIGIFTSGIHINESDNTNIEHCTFGDAGRFHVRVDGGDAKVNILDSDFYGAMKMGEDAGPLEVTSTGHIGTLSLKGGVIAYNKVHDITGIPVSAGPYYNKQKVTAFYLEDTEDYTAHHNLIYNIKANNYSGPHEVERSGDFLYLGPRYNAMHKPVKYLNNTIWNVDNNITIWSIEIENWKQLGLKETHKAGIMKKGHFINNVFMQGSDYVINPQKKSLTATGKTIKDFNNGSRKFTTTDFDGFVKHCKTLDYRLHPKTNTFIPLDKGVKNFVNIAKGNFNLRGTSDAKKSGTKLAINSSDKPDRGAFEGGNRVSKAGASLARPRFREITRNTQSNSRTTNTQFEPTSVQSLIAYPNPVSNVLHIRASRAFPQEISFVMVNKSTGQKVMEKTLYNQGIEISLDVSALPTGVYVLKFSDGSYQEVNILKK